MKIAIVTVYDSIVNFGSFLQAYALRTVLENLGHDVYFVRRMPDEDIITRFNNISYSNLKINETPLWNIPIKISRLKKYKRIEKLNEIRYKLSKKDWEILNIIQPDQIKNMDLVVCGSDEIWNPHNKDIDMDFYTCSWCKDVRKVAYAISSGGLVEKNLEDKYKQNILDFEYCLPRDEKTQDLLKTINASVGELVCDPTILLGKHNFSINASKNIKDKLPEKYLLVYSYVYTKQQKKQLRKFANEHNLKIISTSIDADFVDDVIFTSALDFPYIINNSEFMYAGTFHGAIFGMMFAKRLCILPRLQKIESVVNLCGAQDLIIDQNFTSEILNNHYSNNVNHDLIEKNMAEIRNKSKELLIKMIQE